METTVNVMNEKTKDKYNTTTFVHPQRDIN